MLDSVEGGGHSYKCTQLLDKVNIRVKLQLCQMCLTQGVWKIRELESTRPALPYIHALQTVLHLNKKYLSDVQLPRT